jgi:hypothetical protein
MRVDGWPGKAARFLVNGYRFFRHNYRALVKGFAFFFMIGIFLIMVDFYSDPPIARLDGQIGSA